MKELTKEIAGRIKETRLELNLEIAQVAEKIGINKYQYEDYESGQIDIPVGALLKIASFYNVDASILLSGEKPTDLGYSITRSGEGVSVERHNRYKYRALANNFANKVGKPFVLTIDASDEEVQFSRQHGQEFLYVLDGHVKFYIDEEVFDLYTGDSVYFNSDHPHAVKSENGERSKCLAMILY